MGDDSAEIFYERLMTELVEHWVTLAEESRLEAYEIAQEIEMEESWACSPDPDL